MLAALGCAILPPPGSDEPRAASSSPVANEAGHVRVLPLQGGRNFRDLGGYATADGHHVRWGLLYRSGEMADLTTADYAYLDRLGIRSVCDLRTREEEAARPTRWQGDRKPDYWTADFGTLGDLRRLFGGHPTADSIKTAMVGLYRQLPVSHAVGYRHIFQEMAAGRLPLAFNCSAGKDRTGVGAALILAALGVPRATIEQDYALTDRVVDLKAQLTAGPLAKSGMSPDALEALLSADPHYIDAMFDSVEARWGSVDRYLHDELGVTAPQLRAIKANLLI